MNPKSYRPVAVAVVAAALSAVALSDVTVPGVRGPSTQTDPLLVPSAQGVRLVSILTVPESVGPKLDGATPYRMLGIPDGMGGFDNGDGTFTLLVNHEAGSTSGIARAHGSIGGTVSAWTIDRRTLRVTNGADLVRTTLTWDFATQRWVQQTTAFNRLCSADLAPVSAFFDRASGRGARERIFLSGEEAGNGAGRGFAHIATGPNAGVSVEVPRFGRDSWENLVACPAEQTRTIVAAIDDTTPGQVYFYVGTKQDTGSEIARAGLTNGRLYGVIANATRTEDRTTGIGTTKGQSARFTLADLGDASASGFSTETTADNAGVTEFLRPEDGAWDPSNPRDFWFVTTDRFDQTKNSTGSQVARSRLWRLRFDDISTPENGGTVTVMLDGTEAHNMFDNLCVTGIGFVMIQEDPGNVSWGARIWRYAMSDGSLTEVARFDPAKFGSESAAAVAPYSQDEESSGIFDASRLLGPGWFLIAAQAHGGTAPDAETFENGQICALFDPATVAAPTVTTAASASPSRTVAGGRVELAAEGAAPGDGAVTYAWDFGDGTNGTGARTSHVYTAPGVFTARVTVTHTATGASAQSQVDVTVGRAAPTPSLRIALSFAKEGRDGLVLEGEIPVDAGFDPAGKSLSVDVGGIARSFTLDAKGRGTAADGVAALAVRRTKGTVPAQRARVTVTLRNTSLAADLADEGLTDADASAKPVSVPVSVTLGSTSFDAVADLVWDAKAGRSGSAK